MIEATYFDGTTTRRHAVTLIIHQGVVSMRGEGIRRSQRLAGLDISERLQHAPRILRFPDGAYIEASDHRRLDRSLAQNGYRNPRAVRWQNNPVMSLLALACVLSILIAGYQWGLPQAADTIAQHLPPTIEKKIGDQGLVALDQHFPPSKLTPAEQSRLRDLFATLKQPRGEKTAYRLEFRTSPLGPNAFALPNGVIVMTDQMVQIAGSDDAILGVLSHELGHVQRRHTARHLMQALGAGMLFNLWLGDAPGAVAALPALLVRSSYSRDFEREADQYAIDMMRVNQRPLEPMAKMFENMGAARAGRAHQGHEQEQEQEQRPKRQKPVADYLRSHPSDAERIDKLRAADLKEAGAAGQ